jgi:hypothetical protein
MESTISYNRLTIFNFVATASTGFMHDVIAMNEDYPLIRTEDNDFDDETGLGIPTQGANLHVILLRATRELRYYGVRHQPSAALKLVVADGTGVMFPAVFNSGLKSRLVNVKFFPGTVVVVKRYSMIRLESGKHDEYKLTLLIHDFEYLPVPEKNKEGVYTCSEKVRQMFVDTRAIDHVEQTKCVTYLKSVDLESGYTVWKLADTAKINRSGAFITDPDLKKKYLEWFWARSAKRTCDEFSKRTPPDTAKCQCRLRFDFSQCIAKTVPEESIDKEELFEQVKTRLSGNVEADSFDELKAPHKRWALYYYYAVNVLFIGSSKRTRLPDCLVDTIRDAYPNMDGEDY